MWLVNARQVGKSEGDRDRDILRTFMSSIEEGDPVDLRDLLS